MSGCHQLTACGVHLARPCATCRHVCVRVSGTELFAGARLLFLGRRDLNAQHRERPGPRAGDCCTMTPTMTTDVQFFVVETNGLT